MGMCHVKDFTLITCEADLSRCLISLCWGKLGTKEEASVETVLTRSKNLSLTLGSLESSNLFLALAFLKLEVCASKRCASGVCGPEES